MVIAERGLAARHRMMAMMIMEPVIFCVLCPDELIIGAHSSRLKRYENGELRSKGDDRNPSGSVLSLARRW